MHNKICDYKIIANNFILFLEKYQITFYRIRKTKNKNSAIKIYRKYS